MNTYLIISESYHLINEEIKKIIKDNNYLTFNMNNFSIKDLIDEASYFSFESTKKYIVASNADFFGASKISEEDLELLYKYLLKPNSNTVLIFTSLSNIDSRKKIVKEIKVNNGLIIIPKMDKKTINITLSKYLKNRGYDADYNTINYIIDNSYDNLDIMFNELDKIILYYDKPCKVNYNDVVKIVGTKLDNNNFHFVNAVIEKKLDLALKLLKDLKIYKVEVTSLVILLAREYRLMYYVKKMYANMNITEICSYLGLADWQVSKLYNNSIHYQEKELLNNLVLLCNIDLNIKKGLWDKDVAFYTFLLDACS